MLTHAGSLSAILDEKAEAGQEEQQYMDILDAAGQQRTARIAAIWGKILKHGGNTIRKLLGAKPWAVLTNSTATPLARKSAMTAYLEAAPESDKQLAMSSPFCGHRVRWMYPWTSTRDN
eukprot:825261-Rhodomonas_salina.1